MSFAAEPASRPSVEQLAGAANPFALLVTRYARRPVAFVRDVLGAIPDPWQHAALMALQRGHLRLSIRSGHGVGKDIAFSERTPTPDGERRWGDLQPGDRLFGRNGETTHIVARYDQGVRPIYRVKFDDGTSLRVGAGHLWTVRGRAQRRIDNKRLYRKGVGRGEKPSAYADDFIDLTTAELMARGVKRANGQMLARQWELPPHGAAQYPACDVPLAPYLVGAALGDGSLTEVGLILHGSSEKAAHWDRHITDAGLPCAVRQKGDDCWSVRVYDQAVILRAIGIAGCASSDKFVPAIYRENSPAVRLAVLQGLMDTDGYCDNRGIAVFTSTSQQLAQDVAWLVRSLGGKAFEGDARPSYYTHDGERKRVRDHYDVTVRLPPGLDLFTLPSKARRLRPCEPRYLVRWIDSIELDGEEEAMCVQVDARDGLYLARDFIVTHNTAFLSWVALWFALTRFPFKVVITAPSAPQLYDALWAELLSWLHKLPAAWQALLSTTSDRIELRAAPEDAFITARTSRADQPEALQGVHSAHVLLMADEASGIPEQVFEAAGGSMSTFGAITILTGNPTRSTGFFWRTQALERDRWYTARVSSLDSPRVDPNFAREIAERHGVDSNAYRVRVLGEFPLSDGDTMIAAVLIEEAMTRNIETNLADPEIWGVDVARFGTDRSVLIKRRGNVVREPPRRWAGIDTMQLTGHIMHEWNATPAGPVDLRPRLIVIDSIGIGAGVEDRLRELDVPTLGINVAESPSLEARYMRLRDELWQRAADWIGTRNVSLPYDEQLRDDLAGPRYRYTSDDRLKVESKNEMRSRGVPSPDSGDALILTFSPGALTAMAFQQMRWGQPLRRNIAGTTT